MIRTESITKYFGTRCAVDNFCVEIESEKIIGFLGVNGAGKTTALRMLAGLLAPSSGRVLIDGQDLAGPEGDLARARIGFLPDKPPVYDEMSVRSYLTFAAKLRGHRGDTERIEEIVERTSLEEYADEPIGHLSHGYRQRVGIAQAIVHDPVLVILDEPTSGLDPNQIVEMRGLIRNLRDHHTVLLSSHNLNEVSQTCDELLLIDEGRLEAKGTPEELVATLGGNKDLSLTLKGEQGSIESALSNLQRSDAAQSFSLEPAAGQDLFDVQVAGTAEPEEIARLLVEAGIGVRRMQPSTSQLEHLFSRLTRKSA